MVAVLLLNVREATVLIDFLFTRLLDRLDARRRSILSARSTYVLV